MVYDVDKTNHKVTIIENNGKTYDINTYIIISLKVNPFNTVSAVLP